MLLDFQLSLSLVIHFISFPFYALGFWSIFSPKPFLLSNINIGETLEDNKKTKAYASFSYAWEVTL
jgi:hypothetical protein